MRRHAYTLFLVPLFVPFPAAAMDHHINFSGSKPVTKAYQSTPVLCSNDYEVLRSLGRWMPGQPPNADFLYFMCVSPAGVYPPADDVIGVAHASFSFVMPAESMLLTTLRQMSINKTVVTDTRPFSSRANPWPMHVQKCEKQSQKFEYWSQQLSALTRCEQ